MMRVFISFALAFGLLAGVTPSNLGRADDKKPNVVKTSGEKAKTAAGVDFAGALELSFDSLATLGSRIDQARRACDPVGLLGAANELAAAEKASGKKASLTAESLQKEAVDLAKLRSSSKELKAISALLRDEAIAKELDTQAAKAEKQEADDAKAFKSGEKAKGTTVLKVVNYNNFHITIYVDGYQVGHVYNFGEYSFNIHKKYKAVYLEARQTGGGKYWGPTYITGDYDIFTWYVEQ